MTHLPYLSILKLSGSDVASFLHGQLAADIASLAPAESMFAAYCSPRGQVIALLLVCRSDEEWYLVLESSLADAVLTRLRKYVMRAKVSIELLDELQVAGLDSAVANPPGARVFSPRQTHLHYLLGAAGNSSAEKIPGWRRGELLQGITWLELASSERFLPQMLGLESIGAVSFSKGCYPGQEIVARTRYLGKLKRHPVLLQVESGTDLRAGSSCFVLADGKETEAVAVAVACPADPPCVALLVAALDKTDQVTAVRSGGKSWPAQRLQAWATM